MLGLLLMATILACLAQWRRPVGAGRDPSIVLALAILTPLAWPTFALGWVSFYFHMSSALF